MQHLLRCGDNPGSFNPSDLARPPGRPHRCTKQDFRSVDVADPSNNPLIHQQIFDRGCASAGRLPQIAGIELAAQRLGSEVLKFDGIAQFGPRHSLYQSETSLVVVDEHAAVIELELDMIVPAIYPAR